MYVVKHIINRDRVEEGGDERSFVYPPFSLSIAILARLTALWRAEVTFAVDRLKTMRHVCLARQCRLAASDCGQEAGAVQRQSTVI